jgi:hypothetical protein
MGAKQVMFISSLVRRRQSCNGPKNKKTLKPVLDSGSVLPVGSDPIGAPPLRAAKSQQAEVPCRHVHCEAFLVTVKTQTQYHFDPILSSKFHAKMALPVRSWRV